MSFFQEGIAQENNVLRTSAIALSTDGDVVFMAHQQAKKVVMYVRSTMNPIGEWQLDEAPTGMVVKGDYLYVTSSYAMGFVTAINIKTKKITWRLAVGMGAISPVITKDGATLYVCSQFNNTVSKIDIQSISVKKEVTLIREPKTMVLSEDEQTLYVANFLPLQDANDKVVSSKVSVIATKKMKVLAPISLTNGSNALREMCLSPEGKYVFISHNLGRFQVPTSQLQQGWMNTSGVSVIRTNDNSLIGTFLVDEPEAGAAGVWGLACDTENLVVSQSGTHDVSVIDYKLLVQRLEETVDKETLCYNLRFLTGIRNRFEIKGNGPRSFVMDKKEILIPTYFSDTLSVVNRADFSVAAIGYNAQFKESESQKGEKYFNDASYCFQGWQSCNGCHPGDARTDAMNWDLLNDGIGNPKNCKSMLYAHLTPPAMISGIRPDAETAVRAGFIHIQFAEVAPERTLAVDAYLKSLKPLPSPYLVNGSLSEKAKKGKAVFDKADCIYCHRGPLYTDMKMHRIGESEFEKGWDTPTLREVWRTAPYLHDGSAESIEVLLKEKKHGLKSFRLRKKEMNELIEFVKSI